jgi:ATP-dependent DNA helicase RecG
MDPFAIIDYNACTSDTRCRAGFCGNRQGAVSRGIAVTNANKRERTLADYCQYLKGVGPQRALKLAKLGIENVNELLTHFPRKYYDRRQIHSIASLQPGSEETVVGRILTSAGRNTRRRQSILTAAVGDDTGVIQVVWFNQPYLARHLKPGNEVILTGQLRHYKGQRQIVNPEFEVIGEDLDQDLLSAGRVVPVYRLTEGVSQRFLRKLIARTLDQYADAVSDNLPSFVLEGLDVPSRRKAIREMHFPGDETSFRKAQERLKLEELFYVQLLFSLQRLRRSEKPTHPRLDVGFELERRFLAGMPFELTPAQKRVLDEIHEDLTSARGMNRLLQGDVGSGKTVVAGATLLAAVEAGYQAAMMVPTEILAAQHFEELAPRFERLGVPTALLIGSLKAAERRRVHAGLADGRIKVVVGTHALIQSDVRFHNLALVVIDEQHRFGVRQRAALMRDETTPHVLVMTATPIPRSLALTAYADLDLSVIDEMPATRARIRTHLVPPSKREAMYRFVRDECEKGNRAYFLYPLIEETEKQDLEAAVSAYEELSGGYFEGVPMGLLHGRMNMADKEDVMRRFSSGEIAVLVATTVVEVGVHVPDATIMVVHHPERFGLSQLHQLRGRVGRGGREGYCFLLAGGGLSGDSIDRLGVLARESDGFRIAEEDLRIRGPGEFLGVRQHGVPGFKLANPLRDRGLVEKANAAVRHLLEADPRLATADGQMCRRYLKTIVAEDVALRTVV